MTRDEKVLRQANKDRGLWSTSKKIAGDSESRDPENQPQS